MIRSCFALMLTVAAVPALAASEAKRDLLVCKYQDGWRDKGGLVSIEATEFQAVASWDVFGRTYKLTHRFGREVEGRKARRKCHRRRS